MRYRLIQGHTVRRTQQPLTDVLRAAEAMVASHPEHLPVSVFEAPEGGLVRQVETVGDDRRRKR